MTNKVGAKWKYSGAKRLDDMYDLYVSSAEKPLNKKEYSVVLEECNKEFMNLVLAGREVRMPYLSTVHISKSLNYKRETFDYKHFNETGEKRYISNEHSKGYRAKFKWTKRAMPIVGCAVYSFIATRALQRELATEMKKPNGHAKYSEYGR